MAEPQKFPILVHLWARVLDSVPAVPFFGLDVGLTIVSMVFLTIVRYTALHVLEYVWDWPSAAEEDRTWMAASSFSSITHSSMLCPALFSCLISQPYRPHAPMPDGAADRPWRKAVTALLQFCTGYMVYDAVINIVLPKYPNLTGTDYMFLGHHAATTWYMTTTSVYGAGHLSAMMCMFLGEFTNPFHNAHYIATFAMELDCCNGSRMQTALRYIEFWFALLYCVFRTFLCPGFAVHMTNDLWRNGRAYVPIALLVLWTLLIWAVLFGSIPWIQACWAMLDPYKPAALLPASEEL